MSNPAAPDPKTVIEISKNVKVQAPKFAMEGK